MDVYWHLLISCAAFQLILSARDAQVATFSIAETKTKAVPAR